MPPPTMTLTRPAIMSGHDYEPGEGRHPMHTDPLCRVCGQAKAHVSHRDLEASIARHPAGSRR